MTKQILQCLLARIYREHRVLFLTLRALLLGCLEGPKERTSLLRQSTSFRHTGVEQDNSNQSAAVKQIS